MYQCSNLGQVFQMLQNSKAGPRSKNYLIKYSNGNVLMTEAKCSECWGEHVQQLLNSPLPQGNDELPNKPVNDDYIDICIQPITEVEANEK